MQKQKGGCHCGAVRYEVRELALDKLISCNSSRCNKCGLILGFVSADNFTLVSGEDNLTDYQFNTHTIHHLFCKTCGIQSFSRGVNPSDGAPTVAVNVRCIDDVDAHTLGPQTYNGKEV